MTKRSPELLLQIIDLVAGGCSQAEAARRVGISVSSFWSFVSQSQRDPASWTISFCDSEMPFHECLRLAQKICAQEVLSRFTSRCLLGSDQVLTFQGRVCYKELEAAVGLEPDLRELLGFPRDGLERDAQGNRVPLLVHSEPPVAAVVKFIESNFKQYAQKSELNVNQKIALGVTTVSRTPKPSPPVIDVASSPAAPLPAIENTPIDGDFTEADEDDLRELLGPPAEEPSTVNKLTVDEEPPAARELDTEYPVEPPAEEDMVSAETGEPNGSPEPAPAPAPAPPQPAPTTATRFGNLTPQQLDILNRLRAGVPANATTQPTAMVEKFSANDG